MGCGGSKNRQPSTNPWPDVEHPPRSTLSVDNKTSSVGPNLGRQTSAPLDPQVSRQATTGAQQSQPPGRASTPGHVQAAPGSSAQGEKIISPASRTVQRRAPRAAPPLVSQVRDPSFTPPQAPFPRSSPPHHSSRTAPPPPAPPPPLPRASSSSVSAISTSPASIRKVSPSLSSSSSAASAASPASLQKRSSHNRYCRCRVCEPTRYDAAGEPAEGWATPCDTIDCLCPLCVERERCRSRNPGQHILPIAEQCKVGLCRCKCGCADLQCQRCWKGGIKMREAKRLDMGTALQVGLTGGPEGGREHDERH